MNETKIKKLAETPGAFKDLKGQDRIQVKCLLDLEISDKNWEYIFNCGNCDYYGFPCSNCSYYQFKNSISPASPPLEGGH